MSDFYEQNLAVVQAHHLRLYQQLCAYADRISCEIEEVGSYHDPGVFVIEGQERRLIRDEKCFYKETVFTEINGYLSRIFRQNCALLFLGLDSGLRLMYAFEAGHAWDTYFVIERHPEFLKAVMRHFDLRELLSSQRVFFFIGEEAPQHMLGFLAQEYKMQLPLVSAPFFGPEDNDFYRTAEETVYSFVREALACLKENEDKVASYYRSISQEQLLSVFSGASGRPLRVLTEISHETLFMQHAMRSCISGFEDLKCSTRVLESDFGIISSAYLYGILSDFLPDLFFKINHVARETHEFGGLVTATLVQDFIPFLFNPQVPVGKKIGPHDQVFAQAQIFADELMNQGFEKTRVHYLHFGSDPRVYRPVELSDADRKRYGCDINFICNYPHFSSVKSIIPQDAADRLFEALTEKEEYDLNGFKRLYKQVERESGNIPFNQETCRNIRKNQGPIADEMILTRFVWNSLASAALRLSYLESIADKDIFIYGIGWEADVRFRSRARGTASYGEEVCKICNAGKINVNFHIATNNHSRVFDTIAAGGFMLTRLTPEDSGSEGIGSLFEIGKEIEVFKDKKELRDKIEYYLAHDKQRQEIAYRGRQRFLREHTIAHRMQQVLDVVRKGLE